MDWLDDVPTEEKIREQASYLARFYRVFFEEFIKAGFRHPEAIELVRHAMQFMIGRREKE